MHAAVAAVNSGLSIRKAAEKYNISFSTIRDRVKAGKCYELSLGRKCVFSIDQEREIEQHVLLLAKMYFGVTPIELRRIAFEFATKNGIKQTFSAEKGIAGKDWFYGFITRHPNLSLRKPEATSVNRVQAFNRNEVQHFFSNLEAVISKQKFPATRIYNVDETGISTVQIPSRIVAPKGIKQVGSITSWERGRNITVCCAFSAAGHYIPLMFVFPRKRMSPQLERDGPPGAVYRCSSNGWMTTELFTDWMKHFAEQSNASVDNPVLLVMDNHSSHISLQTYLFCKQKGINIISIPPHTSHRLQPLDLTFFGPLKCAFHKECDLFMKCHAAEKITPYDVPALFNKAYSRVASVDKAARGFQCSGIWPLNPDQFGDDDFMAADNLQRETLTEVRPIMLPVADKDDDLSSPDQVVQEISGVDIPSTSNDFNSTDPETPKSSTKISVAEISPIPGPSNVSRINSRRKPTKMRSQILTASPMKEKLEEAERRRSLKNCGGKTAPKRKCTKNL